jgi:hypothetical protein
VSRWVRPQEPGKTSGDDDDASARIAKYVPAEVVAVFTLLTTILVSLDIPDTARPAAGAGLIALFFVATIAYLVRQIPKGLVRKAHLVVSPVAFLAWAYPIASSALGHWFYPLLAFALMAITLALSIFVKPVEG